jgi:hypothetical protein
MIGRHLVNWVKHWEIRALEERAVLIPVTTEYCDLFLYERSGRRPCINKGFREFKTGDAVLKKEKPLQSALCENSWTTCCREA